MKRSWCVLDSNDCLIDVSKTERGAKNYATRHGYIRIGYRLEYIAFATHEKIGNKWVEIGS